MSHIDQKLYQEDSENQDVLQPKRYYQPIKSPKNIKNYNKSKIEKNSQPPQNKNVYNVYTISRKDENKTQKIKQQKSNVKTVRDIESPRMKNTTCTSQYYVKSPEHKNQSIAFGKLQKQITIKEDQIRQLKIKIDSLEGVNKRLEKEIDIKNEKINMLEKQNHKFYTQQKDNQKLVGILDPAYQYQVYKHDLRRLLKMLESTSQYMHFAKLALADDGVKFVQSKTIHKNTLVEGKHTKQKICCCKVVTSEENHWVPEQVYNFGRDFIKEKDGGLSFSQYELLLYELNRIWREREKRIVNSLKADKVHEIEKYKRKISSCYSLQKKMKDN